MLYPDPTNKTEEDRKAEEIFREKWEEWSEQVDKQEKREVDIEFTSKIEDVEFQMQMEASIEKLEEVIRHLENAFTHNMTEELSKEIGRPTLMECYEEVENE